ncbi:ATP-binding protein, partial [Actinokineospora bangkokensis]|uniref:ATP-binding protein n=1 Tax=Actinokineospora bangkokensis TaxID=1193682 RepID=UPI000AC38B93
MGSPSDPDRGGAPVGRGPQVAVLLACLAAVRGGAPRVLRVRGQAGSGRTSLLRWALGSAPDVVGVWVPGHPDERELPGEAARQVLRGLGVDDDLPATAPAAGDRLLAALLEAQRRTPVAVVLDDAEHVDDESLRAFGHLVRRLRSGRVLVAVTTGGGETPLLGHQPAARAAQARVAGQLGGTAVPPVLVELPPLDVAAVAELAGGAEPELLERLVRFGAGNPALLLAIAAEAELAGPFAPPVPTAVLDP